MPIRRAALVVVLFAGLVAPVATATAQDPLTDARQAVQNAEAEVAAAQVAVDDAQTEANAAADRLFGAFEQQDALEVEIDELQTRIEAARAELDVLADEVRVVLVGQYVDDQRGVGVFDEADLNRGVRVQALSRYVARSRLDSVDEWRVVRLRLDDLDADLADRMAGQAALIDELDEAKDHATAQLVALTIERERLDELVADAEAEEARLIAEEQARRRAEEAERRRVAEAARLAAEEAARLEAEQRAQDEPTPAPASEPDPAPTVESDDSGANPGAEPTSEPTPAPTEAPVVVPDGTPPSTTTGWVCPVAGPNSYTDSWGAPRASGRWHKGTDMLAATGIPVVAVVDGVVEHRGNSIGGLSAHLKGSNGTYFYYTHLSGYANEGAGFVAQGTVIGYVGMTGNAPIPHLHFEHHPGGRGNPVNPYPTLIATC